MLPGRRRHAALTGHQSIHLLQGDCQGITGPQHGPRAGHPDPPEALAFATDLGADLTRRVAPLAEVTAVSAAEAAGLRHLMQHLAVVAS